ncbi:MAG: LemA protein [Candidatus Woesearchaeota archaeon]|nr:LemA protein [Candidatus Woesearchaeota archaeon]
MFWTIIIVAVIVVFVGAFIGIYNNLVRKKNEVENAWAQIDVQLKRRTDLIPNLVETVKGYMKHEKEVLENITKARANLMKAESVKEKANAENMLESTLKSLFAVSENYPDLKANQNFLKLQEELTSTENKISYARQHYNDMVMFFNNKIEQFPSNMIASLFNFKKKELFEVEEAEKEPVKVKF